VDYKMSLPTSSSIKTIQRRLIWTLLKVFLIVTSLLIVVLMGSTLYEISSNASRNPFYKSPSATILEAYYLGHGSWEGLDQLFGTSQSGDSRLTNMEWEKSILLDQKGNVIMYYGKPYPSVPVSTLTMPAEMNMMPLVVNDKMVGTMIQDNRDLPHPVRLAFDVLNPILWISLACAGITLLIGILLMRRIVNPLAEVIAGAESVSAGNFKTRIKMSKSQDDLASLIDHFNHMTETLEKNDNERRGMLADIAHELRTPLSVLRGRLEGIMDGVYAPNEVNIAQALEETYLLERLVEDLRLLTLAETRKLHFELKETDLVELLNKSRTLFEPQAISKSATIEFETEEKQAVVLVDSQRFEQVIGNLIGNALRYSQNGGKITLKLQKLDASTVVKVSDTGPGVPESELPFIFDRFWRGEKSRARVSGGAGLGLAISKQLIEAQGGEISATNRPEGGLEVTVTLPTIAIKPE
jgi:two-component system, OmpR family, sensor histidine kinase BaeS